MHATERVFREKYEKSRGHGGALIQTGSKFLLLLLPFFIFILFICPIMICNNNYHHNKDPRKISHGDLTYSLEGEKKFVHVIGRFPY